ncbi:MAG: amidohydrolase family protein [Proteobacteria bacterium]|nr:amidohydrolase family protein [Pseudomonadota bacterium]
MDLLLRGGILVDGTGAERRRADVGITGDRISGLGELDPRDARETLDLEGLVLAPGFIDPHTHYDAQLLWDPDLTPSSWHGVTSVVMGNCGFGVAPTRPEHRDWIVRTLENVEGMSRAALQSGLDWSFESFPDYLDLLDRIPKRIHAAAMLGHTPLRRFVIGEAATERAATPQELRRMAGLLGEALDAGAAGFSPSRNESHVGAYGRPVPSRRAELSELRALAGVLGERGRGTLESTWGADWFVEENAEIARATGRPVTWAALIAQTSRPEFVDGVLERMGESRGVYPQFSCRPLAAQVTLAEPAPFANMPAFAEVLALEPGERAGRYARPEWRARARADFEAQWGRDRLESASVCESAVHTRLRGSATLGELAAARGAHPLDAMLDLALAEELSTRFAVTFGNDSEAQIARLLNDERLLLGLSDAGAHASQLCDAGFATELLGHWCRERGAVSLERAVWRLTAQPAQVYGLQARGRVVRGALADLVAFDPASVGCGPLERRRDFPAGTERLVAESRGIEHVWVAGRAIRSAGVDLPDSWPGRLIRAG